jgi:hypothetical protein
MLDRSRFNKDEGCNILLSKLASNDVHPHLHAFYEWIDPVTDQVTDQGSGAYQFRTGIRDIRIAIADILEKIKRESPSSYSV